MKVSQYQDLICKTVGDAHRTADSLYHALKEMHPRLSLATVYRNIEQLVDAGKLAKIDSLFGKAWYEKNKGPHGHIICEANQVIYDVIVDDRSFLDLPDNFELRKVDLILHGQYTSADGEVDTCCGTVTHEVE